MLFSPSHTLSLLQITHTHKMASRQTDEETETNTTTSHEETETNTTTSVTSLGELGGHTYENVTLTRYNSSSSAPPELFSTPQWSGGAAAGQKAWR